MRPETEARSILINAHAMAHAWDASHETLSMVIIEIVSFAHPGECNLHKRIVNFFHTFFIG